jgi:hypothetical protein
VSRLANVELNQQDNEGIESMQTIPLGLYRHYKGKDYSVVGFARHSETKETMVLYVPLYGDGGYWVRPLAMFTETVTFEGKQLPRFRLVEEVPGRPKD